MLHSKQHFYISPFADSIKVLTLKILPKALRTISNIIARRLLKTRPTAPKYCHVQTSLRAGTVDYVVLLKDKILFVLF